MPGSRARHTSYDRWARRWQEDCTDQGGRGVAFNHEHGPSPLDAGRGFRSARNGSNPSDATELIHVLREIIPKPIAPHLTASTSAACGEFIRQWRGRLACPPPAFSSSMPAKFFFRTPNYIVRKTKNVEQQMLLELFPSAC